MTPIDPALLNVDIQNEVSEFSVTRDDPNVSVVTLANVSARAVVPLRATIENARSSTLFTSTPSAVYANGNVLVSFGTAISLGTYSGTATLTDSVRTWPLPFTITVEALSVTLTRDGQTINAGDTVYGTGMRKGAVYGSGFGVRAPISITLSSNRLANVNVQLSLSSTQSINVFVRGITSSSAVATVFKLATGSSSQLSASLAIDNSTNTYVVIDFCVMTDNGSCLNDRDISLSVAQQLSLEIAYQFTETASTQTMQTITVKAIAPDFLAVRTQNERQEFTITRNDPNVSAVTLANISSDTSGLPALKAMIENAVSSTLFTSTPSAVYADGNVLVSFGTAVNIGSYSTTATLVSGARTRTFMFTIRVVEAIPTITLTARWSNDHRRRNSVWHRCA